VLLLNMKEEKPQDSWSINVYLSGLFC